MNKSRLTTSLVLILGVLAVVLSVICQITSAPDKQSQPAASKIGAETVQNAAFMSLPITKTTTQMDGNTASMLMPVAAKTSAESGKNAAAIPLSDKKIRGETTSITEPEETSVQRTDVSQGQIQGQDSWTASVPNRILPMNSLPTDRQIEESIEAQLNTKQTMDKLVAERDRKMNEIRREIDSSEITSAPPSADQTPPEEFLQKIRSKIYVVH